MLGIYQEKKGGGGPVMLPSPTWPFAALYLCQIHITQYFFKCTSEGCGAFEKLADIYMMEFLSNE